MFCLTFCLKKYSRENVVYWYACWRVWTWYFVAVASAVKSVTASQPGNGQFIRNAFLVANKLQTIAPPPSLSLWLQYLGRIAAFKRHVEVDSACTVNGGNSQTYCKRPSQWVQYWSTKPWPPRLRTWQLFKILFFKTKNVTFSHPLGVQCSAILRRKKLPWKKLKQSSQKLHGSTGRGCNSRSEQKIVTNNYLPEFSFEFPLVGCQKHRWHLIKRWNNKLAHAQ